MTLHEAQARPGLLGGWLARLREWLRPKPRLLLSDGRPGARAFAAVAAAKAAAEQVDRFEIVQRIWGPGFVLPGAAEYLMNVVNPLAVDSSMSLLDLTAGLGGPSRHVAKTFDVYVTALDRSIELAERGQAMSVAAGLGKRVPVRSFDVETVEFKPRSFDAAWAQFLTCGVADKERLFREVHRGLRPRGQISIVEFMLRDADPADPRIVALRHPVQGRLQLWRMSQYLDCLGNAGFVCRAMEDHSAVLRGHVMRGWRDVLKAEDWRSRSRRQLVALFEEAEMWFRLLAAIDAGLVGVTRLHAIVK